MEMPDPMDESAEVVVEGTSYVLAYIGGGIGWCVIMLLILLNLWNLISMMREKSDESASAMAKAAWAVGFASMFLGPCGWFTALVAIVLAKIETGRIYRGESSIRSATPARMASINGGMYIIVSFVTAFFLATPFLM